MLVAALVAPTAAAAGAAAPAARSRAGSLAVTAPAARAAGTLVAWGAGEFGQLGNGTTISRNKPVRISVALAGARLGTLRSLAAGGGDSLALFSSGTVLAWDENDDGELGDGTTTGSLTPVRVTLPAGRTAIGLAGGGFDSFAIVRP